jgi:DHA1 family bicyclomycin/chloramphenicol resistance-like MFS transporter
MPHARPTLSGMPGWLVLLGALTALGPLSIDMYLPGFPSMAESLHASRGAVERTLAVFFIGLALGQLIGGPVSDRFGRKPPLYAGLALYCIASLGCAQTDSIAMLTGWRFLQAFGGSFGMVISRAVIRDRTTLQESARAFSLLMLVMGLAPILAPMIGSALLQWTGWRGIFLALAAFSAACGLAVHWTMSESLSPAHVRPLSLGHVLRGYGALLRHPQFMAYALSGSVALAGMFAYVAGSPYVLIQYYGVSPGAYGALFGLNAIGLIGAAQINARLLRRRATNDVLNLSIWGPVLPMLVALGLVLSGNDTLPSFMACLFCFTSSIGFIGPNAAAIALSGQGEHAGAASALLGAIQFSLGTLAGATLSIWHHPSPLPLAGVMAGCGASACVVYLLFARRHAPNLHPRPELR